MWLSRKRMAELSDEFAALETERDNLKLKLFLSDVRYAMLDRQLAETQTAALEMQQEINLHRDLCLPQLVISAPN